MVDLAPGAMARPGLLAQGDGKPECGGTGAVIVAVPDCEASGVKTWENVELQEPNARGQLLKNSAPVCMGSGSGSGSG